MKKTSRAKSPGLWLAHILLGFLSLMALFPFLWMVATSFKQTTVLFRWPPEFIPRSPTTANYVSLWTQSDFVYWMKNSVIISAVVTTISLLFNSMAAYSFAKRSFPGRDILFLLVLGTLMVPGQVTLVPVFLLISKLKWVNTYQAMILPLVAGPFGIFLMRQYMVTIPDALIDAARIDGCSEFGIFTGIILPLVKPALAALAVFAFQGSWNSFLWPLVVTTTSKMRTLPVGLAVYQAQFTTQWGLVMAGATLTMIPVLVFFLLFQRYFVEGLALTGIKG
ncbi:MAG: carbohydrate ABC transporter permease [Firmicutes bacterium]|nr:carbohydrate ABC transporter permease [Bacillota bacterium]